MGQSAGAISIGFHLLSPSSAGLFKRAFMQSGSPFIGAFVSTQEQMASRTDTFASYLDCKEKDSIHLSAAEVMACLRSKDIGDVLKASENFDEAEFNGFFPFFGGEGDFLIAYLLARLNIVENIGRVTGRRMEAIMRLVLSRVLVGADINAIIDRYLGSVPGKNAVEVVHAAGDIMGDLLFGCPAVRVARALVAANVSVHVLRYSEQLSFLDWPKWVRPTHSDDIVFSLGSSFNLGDSPSEADVRATENLINVVSTFARTGVPMVTDGTKWPKFDEEGQYLHIRNGSNIQEKHFLESTCNFWHNYNGNVGWTKRYISLYAVPWSEELKRRLSVLSTACGDVRGIIRTTTTGPVLAFLGIPFAEPPLGERRFKKPTPKKPWKGVLNASSLPPMCPQVPVRVNNHFEVKAADLFSEDCLFLNVFKPVRNHGSTLKRVVVFVHGGAFTFGGIYLKIFDASELAVRGDLVVVTIAYRLGPFGFLYLGTEEAPGNMGLYDQQLAMRWVRENARSFGGDPDVITAMGQSAGGHVAGHSPDVAQ
ncbi:hypothetical protein MTO96_025784 [Rhipicephalus appendiculatus]